VELLYQTTFKYILQEVPKSCRIDPVTLDRVGRRELININTDLQVP